ncbi:hypothetical protein MAJ_06080, partial [Metarhizium majus ARSEF 297]
MEDPGVKNNKTTPTERRSQSPASTPAQAHTASEGADTAAAPSANRATISGASSEEPPASESVPQTKQENGVSHETEGASSRSGGAEQPDKGEQTPPSLTMAGTRTKRFEMALSAVAPGGLGSAVRGSCCGLPSSMLPRCFINSFGPTATPRPALGGCHHVDLSLDASNSAVLQSRRAGRVFVSG